MISFMQRVIKRSHGFTIFEFFRRSIINLLMWSWPLSHLNLTYKSVRSHTILGSSRHLLCTDNKSLSPTHYRQRCRRIGGVFSVILGYAVDSMFSGGSGKFDPIQYSVFDCVSVSAYVEEQTDFFIMFGSLDRSSREWAHKVEMTRPIKH